MSGLPNVFAVCFPGCGGNEKEWTGRGACHLRGHPSNAVGARCAACSHHEQICACRCGVLDDRMRGISRRSNVFVNFNPRCSFRSRTHTFDLLVQRLRACTGRVRDVKRRNMCMTAAWPQSRCPCERNGECAAGDLRKIHWCENALERKPQIDSGDETRARRGSDDFGGRASHRLVRAGAAVWTQNHRVCADFGSKRHDRGRGRA